MSNWEGANLPARVSSPESETQLSQPTDYSQYTNTPVKHIPQPSTPKPSIMVVCESVPTTLSG